MFAEVVHFFDPATFTFSYVVRDPGSAACAIIDAVLDYDPATGRVSTDSADRLVAYVQRHGLSVEWILETHVHADHLSASRYLQGHVGGKTAIGRGVTRVQQTFAKHFNVAIATDGSQYDQLLDEDSRLRVGKLDFRVLATPGHTPGCVTYVLPNPTHGMAFVGDTLFMPDYGTARTDFPGGDAATLYSSIQKIFALPESTTIYLCHDYLTDVRTDYRNHATVAEQRTDNIHIHSGVSLESFVAQRESRDSGLAAPKLLLPAVQFNMCGGLFPQAESNGTHYFKVPLNLTELEANGS